MYAKWMDKARIVVAVAMAICGVGLVVCVRKDDYLTGMLRLEPGIWQWGVSVFGIGICTCLITTLAIVIEHLARPAELTPSALRSFFFRASIIAAIVVGAGVSAAIVLGPLQGFGTVVGVLLAIGAVRQHREARVLLAVMAALVFGLVVWSLQPSHCREKGGTQKTAYSRSLEHLIHNT